MEEFWKKSADKARKNFTDRNRTSPDGSLKDTQGPPKPPDAATQAANAAKIKDNQRRIDELKESTAPADQAERAQLRRDNNAMRKDCRQSQADYLAWYNDNGKTPPEMTPCPPGATPPPGAPPTEEVVE